MSEYNDDAVIPGFNSMTAQEIFDISAVHLLTQNVRAYGMIVGGACSSVPGEEMEGCAYRGPNGTKCAAGVFLTDESAKKFENVTWPLVVDNLHINPAHTNLICVLQNVHDGIRDVADWKRKLIEVAKNFNLSTVAIDTL